MPRGFICWVAALAGTSWAGLTLTQIGWFSGAASLAFGLALAAAVAWWLPASGSESGRASRWIAGLSLLLCMTLLPAIDTTLLSQDASVHRAAGHWLARTGSLAIPDPALESVDPQGRLVLFSGGSHSDKRTSLVRIPGGIVIPDMEGTVAYPSFSHLLSVWVALSTSLLGAAGPSGLGILFAFTAWWAVGLIAWRDGGGWAAAAALGLLATWLPEHWFGRFLMPEILAQALVWSGVAAARFSMEACGLDGQGRASGTKPAPEARRAGVVAGALAGLCLGVASFARLEQFWVFVPALLLVRVFLPPGRWLLPPGALAPFLVTAMQSVFHLLWLPTDYGNRIYKTAIGIYLTFVLHLADLVQGNGWILTPLLNRVLPACVILGVVALLWWGRRLDRRSPGSLFRPLLGVVVVFWLAHLYSRGLPDEFPVVQSLEWYIPWPVWGAVIAGIPALASLPALEIALLLEALDQVVWGRVSPEHIWASRRLVTVALPVLALAAVRGGFVGLRAGTLGRAGAYAARGLIVVALVLGAAGLRPVLGVPLQAGGHEFVADFAHDIPPESTVLLVQPLDWLHLGSALWLGEGRHAVVMREEGYPGYDEELERFLLSRLDAPLFVLAGAVVGPQGGDDEALGELARLPDSLRLERVSSWLWTASFLEVTRERPPVNIIERRAFLHLYRAHAAP